MRTILIMLPAFLLLFKICDKVNSTLLGKAAAKIYGLKHNSHKMS